MTPNFDEIVGSEPGGAERDRLRNVHELLVAAGPPPELSPELQQATLRLADVHFLKRKSWGRRALILIAAALLAAIVFIGGFSGGHHNVGQVEQSLTMHGTSAAPHAQGRLDILQPHAGKWPMRLTVADLPELPPHGYYVVYLVRHGTPWAPCGKFRVTSIAQATTVNLHAPYALRSGDSWVVTRELPFESRPGPTVLRPSV